jgi:drug/metabolite transporter (DMT)-like permease
MSLRSTHTSSPIPHPLRVHGALFTVAVLFSINYIVSKFGMRAFAPLSFAYLRVVGAAVVLNAFLPRDREPLQPGDQRRLALYAFLGVVTNQALFLYGLSLTSAHVAAILITAIPVFTLAIAMALGRERATPAKIGGILLTVLGALIVVWGEGMEGTTRSLAGVLMLIGNCFSFALYLVLSKPMMARISAHRVVARMFAVGAVLMLPISAWSLAHQQWQAIPPRAWISLLVVIAGPTIGAYLLNAWGLKHADSSLVAAYVCVQPVLTVVLAAVFLGERIRPEALVAGVLIFTGVWLASRK